MRPALLLDRVARIHASEAPQPEQQARLDAIPWARFTVEAQAQLERDGAMRHRRLGSLGTLDAGAPAEIEEDDEVEEKPAKEKE